MGSIYTRACNGYLAPTHPRYHLCYVGWGLPRSRCQGGIRCVREEVEEGQRRKRQERFKKPWHLRLDRIRRETVGRLRLTGSVWPWLGGERVLCLVSWWPGTVNVAVDLEGQHQVAIKPPTAWDPGAPSHGWRSTVPVSSNPCIISELLHRFRPRLRICVVSHLKVKFDIWRVDSCRTPDFLLFWCQAHSRANDLLWKAGLAHSSLLTTFTL